MLPIIFNLSRRPHHLALRRSFANAPSPPSSSSTNQANQTKSTSSSTTEPALIKGMPQLIVPPQYVGLYDVKQEPGFVIVNGKKYPYPYPGIHKEYNYLEYLEKWRREGKLDDHDRPQFSKMKGREKILAQQLWYQRDPSLPIWKLGKFDRQINVALATYAAFVSMLGLYMWYRVVVPKEQDIYDVKNWNRWRKEAAAAHH